MSLLVRVAILPRDGRASRSLGVMEQTTTIGDQARLAADAYETLSELGEEIEDEWTYVTELTTSWLDRIDELIEARGTEAAGEPEQAAIAQLIDEVGRITDPHRAIDWLSTFPQVVLLTFGEQA